MKSAFPGFDSPAVGFEQPFEMLLACHERVRRSLSLLGRLVSRVGERGHARAALRPRQRQDVLDVLAAHAAAADDAVANYLCHPFKPPCVKPPTTRS